MKYNATCLKRGTCSLNKHCYVFKTVLVSVPEVV